MQFAEYSQHIRQIFAQRQLYRKGSLCSGGSRGGSGGSLESPSPVFNYPMKMKKFGLSETKLFHFHGIFKKI